MNPKVLCSCPKLIAYCKRYYVKFVCLISGMVLRYSLRYGLSRSINSNFLNPSNYNFVQNVKLALKFVTL